MIESTQTDFMKLILSVSLHQMHFENENYFFSPLTQRNLLQLHADLHVLNYNNNPIDVCAN